MEDVAANQKKNADGQRHVRDEAGIAVLPCGGVRALTFQGAAVLDVLARPLDYNAAHCGIFNVCGTSSRGFMSEVRGKLARLASKVMTFDEIYDAPADDSGR